MKLYSSKVDDVAKPVVEEVKEKKPRTEKQIAALEKAKEARKRKRDEIESKKEEIKAKEEEIKVAEQERTPSLTSEEEAPVKKSRKQVTPRRREVQPPKDVDPVKENLVEKPVEAAVAKVSKPADDVHEPPAWFKTFIANTRAEEAKLNKVKRPRKVVKQEAAEMAQTKWQDSHTRDRVNTQAENHMRQMHQLYGQIFRR